MRIYPLFILLINPEFHQSCLNNKITWKAFAAPNNLIGNIAYRDRWSEMPMWVQVFESEKRICFSDGWMHTGRFVWTSTYLLSCMSVWIVELSSSLVMCVGLMVRPSPFVSALTTLSNWSPNRGIASTGTAWYTACSRLFCPPWVMKRRAFVWPRVNKE